MGTKVNVTRDATTGTISPPLTPYIPNPMKSGGKFTAPFASHGSIILQEGEMVAHPLDWQPGMSLPSIYAFVTPAGTIGAVLRMGVYSDDGGRPNTLLHADLGTVAADSTGAKQRDPALSASTLEFTTRLWLAIVVQGGAGTRPTLLNGSGRVPGINLGSTASSAFNIPVNGFKTAAAAVTGAMPTTWPAFFFSSDSPVILAGTS